MRVIVVGGGFAGVSAAVTLADRGHAVELHEIHSALGGRAHHVPPPPGFPVPLDSGPHLFSGAYHETLDLLQKLGRENVFHWIDPLELNWLLPGGTSVSLNAVPLPAPFHLAWGLLLSDAFTFRHKCGLLSDLWSLRSIEPHGKTVAQYLDENMVAAQVRKRFWEPLTRAIINMPPELAPLEGLTSTVPRMFFGNRKDASFAVARMPLSDIFGDSVSRFLEKHQSRVFLRSIVESVQTHDGRVQSAQTNTGEKLHADAWVFAVPPARLAQLLPEVTWANHTEALGSSPIVSAHFFLDHPIWEGHFACLDGARFEWLFNRNQNWDLPIQGQVLSLLASADKDLAAKNEKDLLEIAWKELTDRCPEASGAKVLAERVTKEMNATFAWTLVNGSHRPVARTPLSNLALAGDWTATGLPATIEGAVISGRLAAESLWNRAKS
jgi:zeta-carotene desaturase